MIDILQKKKYDFLIDTDIIINHLKGVYNIKTELLKEGNLNISVLSEYELYNGIRDDEALEEIEDLLYFFNKINITSEICKTASKLNKRDKHLILSLKLVDLLIASTCIINKFVLVTNNKKHFKLIPEIKIHG